MGTWKEDLNYGLGAFGLRLPDRVPLDDWASKLAGAPCRNSAALVAASSVLFFAAERGHNPKVKDIYDAMIYTSTCLSVGYSDIFAKTPTGKLIGTLLMTIGPALAARALDGTAANAAAGRQETVQEQILATLQQILEKMGPSLSTSGG